MADDLAEKVAGTAYGAQDLIISDLTSPNPSKMLAVTMADGVEDEELES